MLTGAGILGAGATVSGLSGVAQAATQTDWRWCNYCAQLFHTTNGVGGGLCPQLTNSDNFPVPHSVGSSTIYTLNHDESNGSAWQAGWRSCGQCTTLFYGPYRGTSLCPAGWTAGNSINHTILSGSYSYDLEMNTGGPQNGWNYCGSCKGLYHGSGHNGGFCPATLGPHTLGSSTDYHVPD